MNVIKFFENPDALWNLLWLIPLFVGLSYYAVDKRKKLCRMLLGDRFDNPEFSNLSKPKRNLKSWLVAFALVLLVVAASRPFWGMKILPYSGSGRDLMIVLDVSKSMLAEDVKPSRIDHAKWFLRELIKSTPGDRYGLVAFSGSAFLECPMTVDKTSLFQIIEEMHPGSIPLGGTNIENAINVALDAFQAAETPHRAIILVTDGDELQGNMAQTAKKLSERHIPLYVVGVGDPTQPGLVMNIEEETGKKGFLKDNKGEIVKSSLNENALAKLANECDGIYVRSTATKSCLQPLLNKINTLVPEKYRTGQNTRNIERFHIPLFFAVILLLITMLIGETRKPAIVLLLLSFTFSGFSQANPVVPPAGEENKPAIAVTPAEDAKNGQGNSDVQQDKKKIAPEQIYNEAVELHQKKDIKNANELYQRAINSSGNAAEVRGKSFQNLGVIMHEDAREMMKKMELENAEKLLNHAEEMYRESMASDKLLADTAMNQQKLINDRKVLEELKKKQKEMQDKKKEAKDKTQKAMDKNKEAQKQENKEQKDNKDNKEQKQDQQQNKDQQENQDQKDQKQEQGQEQKDQKQQQKQDQQKSQEQKKDPSQEAQEKTKEAQKAVEDYKKEAEKQNSQNDKQSAQNAEKELEKAKQEQKKDDFKKAEDNLKKALEALGGKEDKDKKEQDKDKDKKQDQQKPEQDKKGKDDDKKLPKPQDQKMQEQPQEQKEEEIDPSQAEALLNLMEKDEKSLRDQLKEIDKQNSRIKEVEKDW